MFIKSVHARIHDTGFGGYPYKLVVEVCLPMADFNKLCPKIGPTPKSYFGSREVRRYLGNLVLGVNSALYNMFPKVPSYNPSIDAQGHRRAVKGIKTLIFEYFFKDHDVAESLGFEMHRFKSGEMSPKYGQVINLKVS